MIHAIESTLNSAEQSLGAPDFELVLAQRYAVWKQLGRRDQQSGVIDVGHRRRARLALLSAAKVLPLWERWRPDDRRPQRMLADAEHFLTVGEKRPIPDGDDNYKYFDVALDNLASIDQPEVMAGYAAVAAFRIVFDDQAFDPDEEPAEDEYDDPDAAWAAAVAYAGGTPGQPGSSPDRRHAFWRWWLREAVPATIREYP